MKCSSLKCGLLLLVSASAYTLVTKVTPVQKVLEMMGEMKVSAEKMKEAEAATFRKYANWADDQQTELGFEIKTGKSEIEKLIATIESADLDVEKLGKKITAMNKEINRMETEAKDATSLRKKENDIFMSTQADLAESVDAIGRATETIQSGAQDKEQAMMLLQQMATTVPKMPFIIAAFLEEDELGAPKAAAYESQSGGVLGMLEGLAKKFKKELDECELEESNKAHAYSLEVQHLGDTVEATKADLSEKEVEKGKTAAESAKAKGDLQKTKDELSEDEKMLVEVTATFRTKQAMFAGNQKTRKDELTAIGKAIEIISSPDVSLTQRQPQQAPSLLQTQSSQRRVAVKTKVANLLEQRAELLSSSTLKSFVSELAGSPFAKVTGLIKGLIAKLKEEASAEAEHKKWCDDQLKTNKLKRNKQGTQADKLDASLEKLAGEIDTMGKEIASLSAEQSALTKAQSKATEIRMEEKTSNAKTVKDAVAGAAAVKQALTVLKKFYSAQALLQQAPDMEKFGGQQGAGKGVMGMLEVIESDFLRLKAETGADEAQAAKEYDAFMKEATTNKGEKKTKETKLRLDKDKAENQVTIQNKDLKLTNTKLAKANKYFETLKPTCMEIHVSFEERAARRKEEINALKEAYGILDNKSDE